MSAPSRTAPRIRIVNDDGRGFMTKVFIDDQDVSECFSGIKVSAGMTGALLAELEPTMAAVEFGGLEHLRIPSDTTRELLIRHGWEPPAEPVTVTVERRCSDMPYEPLAPGLFGEGEPIEGRELVGRLYERLGADWEPSDEDRITVERVYDENDHIVPGKARYTLAVVLDSERPEEYASAKAAKAEADAAAISTVRSWCTSGEAKRIRKDANLSQSDLADLVGTTPAAVCRWESGQRAPRRAAAVRYHDALVRLRDLASSSEPVTIPRRDFPQGVAA